MPKHEPCSLPEHSIIPHCDICHLVMPCLDGEIIRWAAKSPATAPPTVDEIRKVLAQ